jgi:RNase P subunit RPR2
MEIKLLNYKDYMQIQISKDVKCSCCDYTIVKGSNMWVRSVDSDFEPLCTPCWNKKRREQKCGEREGHEK